MPYIGMSRIRTDKNLSITASSLTRAAGAGGVHGQGNVRRHSADAVSRDHGGGRRVG